MKYMYMSCKEFILLRLGLGHYMMGGFLPGLKRVSCYPSDRPRKGNMGAQQVMIWHVHQSLSV